MKFSIALIASIQAEPLLNRVARQSDAPENNANRRYVQLTDMMQHYNSEFDERKYWTYGLTNIFIRFFGQKLTV